MTNSEDVVLNRGKAETSHSPVSLACIHHTQGDPKSHASPSVDSEADEEALAAFWRGCRGMQSERCRF
jgi:hypothetical protein